MEREVLAARPASTTPRSKRLVALANRSARPSPLGLAEVPSTRLPWSTARLIASGLRPGRPATRASTEALTDDPALASALLCCLVALVFDGRAAPQLDWEVGVFQVLRGLAVGVPRRRRSTRAGGRRSSPCCCA
ncbi:MAG: CbbQ/NirQ/NorQ C-terminal domain-containing protein [Myxococcota bacterium]